ncbi:glycosyltransferase family 4 protein [Candidatus Villigracilis affinis]|uniref:glycosyltransferase family 4 protein n=1 Tax=Candidatus Villigracilis affinis TaxID=3140682 RepID=UPI001E084C59|nr:glycosyltransferase family 4 protein [Anaerolineales bacterium]
MKIGLVIYGSIDTLSGGYMYDRMLVEHLRAQGDTVEIISLPWRNYAAHLTDNFTFKLPPNLDILIQDELNHPSLIGANRGKHPYPVISLVHHLRCSELRPKWQNDFYRPIEKKYLQSVDGFIFNSRTTKGVVNGLIGSGKPDVVAYPPTDRFGEAISEEEIKERSKKKELHILFLGNVMGRKGLHTLLEAAKDLKSKVVVDVVGSPSAEPEYTKQIQSFIADNHLSSFVFLHGALNNQPLIEKLKAAHILVVPSSYEGFGIVYLEGMGFGLPAIGTTLGAAGEVIEDGVTGFLIQPGDSHSLATKLQIMNERRDLLIQMSLAARRRYLAQPKWEQTANQIREFLRSFLR